MNYNDLLLPAGWAISKPYRATWIQAGKPTTKPTVRDLSNPHDATTRTLPAKLTVEVLDLVQTVLANYGAPAAVLAAKPAPVTYDASLRTYWCEDRAAFYDKGRGCSNTWILTRHDIQGNQVGDADYTHARADAMRWLKTGSLCESAEKGTKEH